MYSHGTYEYDHSVLYCIMYVLYSLAMINLNSRPVINFLCVYHTANAVLYPAKYAVNVYYPRFPYEIPVQKLIRK